MADTQTRTAALQVLFGGPLQGVVTQRTFVAGYRRFGTTHLTSPDIRDGSSKCYGETTEQHRTTYDSMDCSAVRQHRQTP
jgi:hypothetical protein